MRMYQGFTFCNFAAHCQYSASTDALFLLSSEIFVISMQNARIVKCICKVFEESFGTTKCVTNLQDSMPLGVVLCCESGALSVTCGGNFCPVKEARRQMNKSGMNSYDRTSPPVFLCVCDKN